MGANFSVEFLNEAAEFIDRLDEKARDKIIYNIRKAQSSRNNDLFKKLSGEIWEFRTLFNRKYYRLFAFWDRSGRTKTVVISTHGLLKKTGKTPKAELEKAERLRRSYFEMKEQK